MEMLKIIFLTVRVSAQVTPQNITEPIIQISKPQISQSPSNQVFYSSEKVTLKCEVAEAPSGLQYDWINNSTPLVDNNSEITVEYGGKYECKVRKGASESEKSNSHTLAFQDIPTPKLTLQPMRAKFYSSETVTLTCEIEGSTDNWTYKWYKNGEYRQGSLNITLATKDSGNYTCQGILQDRVTTANSTAVTLKVNDRPTVQVNSEWKDAFPTETVSLKCTIQVVSENWIYTWFKDENIVSNGTDTKINENTLSLSVKPGHRDTPGIRSYVCQAELKGRAVKTDKSKPYKLFIYGPPIVPTTESNGVGEDIPTPKLTLQPMRAKFYSSETVTLTCEIEGSTDNWTYKWYKNGEYRQGSLKITLAINDSGNYTCQGILQDRVTTANSTAVTLKVNDRPTVQVNSEWKDAFPTETVSLKCTIQVVSENWIYTWFKDENIVSNGTDTKINENTLSLSVKPGHRDTPGIRSYVCQAELKGRAVKTDKSKPYKLFIYGSQPTILLKQIPEYAKIYTREQVTLTCIIEEETSEWKFQWIKDPVNIVNDTYTISSAAPFHSGNYTCHISRRGVTFSSEPKLLTISKPPQPEMSIKSKWKTFYPSETVTLKCAINETPDAWSYEWYKNKTKLSATESTLSILAENISDSGSYKCKGKHKKRLPVTTNESKALQLEIFGFTPKPVTKKHPSYEFLYTEEQVQLTCNMPGVGWVYDWYKDSHKLKLPSVANANYTITQASLSDNGKYFCEAKRGTFQIQSEAVTVQVQTRPDAVLSLVTDLKDIIAGKVNIFTMKCEVTDEIKEWNYTWYENDVEQNKTSSMFAVTANDKNIKSEYKCRGVRTERPKYCSLSEGFTAHNLVLKRKILLAISGCVICCIVILIIGCIILKITRKPEKKETVHQNLFISIADSKNQTTSPLMEYMDSKPTDKESGEKEELVLDRISVTHVDGVIKGEDTPSGEANGLTSFKGN